MSQSTSTRAHKGNESPSKDGVSKRTPTSSSRKSLKVFAEKVVYSPEILNHSKSNLSITPPATTTLAVSSANSDITATYSQDAGHISSAGQSDVTDHRDSNATAKKNVTIHYDPVYLEVPSDIPDLERELLEGYNRLQRDLLHTYEPIPDYYTFNPEITSATDHNIPVGYSNDSYHTSTTNHSSSVGHHTVADDDGVTNHKKLARPAVLPGARGVVKDKSSIRSKLVKAQQEMKRQKNAGITTGRDGSILFPPTDDATLPSSRDEHETLVNGLIAAMLNNKDCLEVETEEFTTRWGDGATYYTPEDMRAAIEELISEMLTIHKHGWTKRIYDPDRRDLIQKTMFFTFEDRYEAIRKYFKISKTICADILKGERFWSLLGNPAELMKRARMNERQNKNKRARLNWASAAEKAGKQQKRAREEEEGVDEEARPSKKVREA